MFTIQLIMDSGEAPPNPIPPAALFTINVVVDDDNRSPKGNMWSAIPVALLCMIVN